jgi:hypothetical protein
MADISMRFLSSKVYWLLPSLHLVVMPTYLSARLRLSCNDCRNARKPSSVPIYGVVTAPLSRSERSIVCDLLSTADRDVVELAEIFYPSLCLYWIQLLVRESSRLCIDNTMATISWVDNCLALADFFLWLCPSVGSCSLYAETDESTSDDVIDR